MESPYISYYYQNFSTHGYSFETFKKAESVAKILKAIASIYGYVTISDFKRSVGIKDDLFSSYVEDRYGWNAYEIEKMLIMKHDGAEFYYIHLPRFTFPVKKATPNEIRKTDGLDPVKSSDPVNHPSHYATKSGLEAIEVIEAFTEDLQGIEAVDTANVLKYICRWKKKNGLQDLEKASWYLNNLIEHEKNEEKENKNGQL